MSPGNWSRFSETNFMRKLILLPFFLLGVLLFFPSCKKESHDTMGIITPDETMYVKIATNQLYQLDITDAGSVSISKQAIHFLVSETLEINESGTSGYKYIPATDFTGNDEVILLLTKNVRNNSVNNGGACQSGNRGNTTSARDKYIRLIIKVGN